MARRNWGQQWERTREKRESLWDSAESLGGPKEERPYSGLLMGGRAPVKDDINEYWGGAHKRLKRTKRKFLRNS